MIEQLGPPASKPSPGSDPPAIVRVEAEEEMDLSDLLRIPAPPASFGHADYRIRLFAGLVPDQNDFHASAVDLALAALNEDAPKQRETYDGLFRIAQRLLQQYRADTKLNLFEGLATDDREILCRAGASLAFYLETTRGLDVERFYLQVRETPSPNIAALLASPSSPAAFAAAEWKLLERIRK